MSCTKDQLYGNSTCTKSSCQKEYLYRGYVQQYTESRYIKSVACTNMQNSSYRMHVHVTMFVSVCTIITRQVYCMPHYAITMMYRSMFVTMQVCAQV